MKSIAMTLLFAAAVSGLTLAVERVSAQSVVTGPAPTSPAIGSTINMTCLANGSMKLTVTPHP